MNEGLLMVADMSDPLNQTIAQLLRAAAGPWQDWNPDNRSSTEDAAIDLLCRARLIHARLELRAGIDHSQEWLLRYEAQGDWEPRDYQLPHFMPQLWQWNSCGDMVATPGAWIADPRYVGMRQSLAGDQMVAGCTDAQLVTYVRREGYWRGLPYPPGQLKLLSVGRADAGGNVAMAAAKAEARVGDITVHNHNTVTMDVSPLVEAMRGQAASSAADNPQDSSRQTPTSEQIFGQLKPAERRGYLAYLAACRKLEEIGQTATEAAVWHMVQDEGVEIEWDGSVLEYTPPPSKKSFFDYARKGEAAFLKCSKPED